VITMIEVVEGFEPYWEVWGNDDKYLGEVHLEELDLFVKGVTDNGGEIEFVRGDIA
jgi:hypothetical protein